MIFTLENVLNSLAGVIKAEYPDYPVYMSPNQQSTKYPCFFLFFMPSKISGEVGSRSMRDLGLDIVFVQQRNIADGNEEIHQVAEYLDMSLESFLYQDGSGNAVPLHTFERTWQIEDEELHYQLHIRQRVSVPSIRSFMKKMEENNAYIKEESHNRGADTAEKVSDRAAFEEPALSRISAGLRQSDLDRAGLLCGGGHDSSG